MADDALGPGSVVASRFRLEDLLDEHAGARFWRATDLALARSVAVHVLSSDDPRAAAAMQAARRSATVTDTHLLRVLDAIEENGHLHVVHEWGWGVSLDRMLAEGPLEPRRAAWLVREVADGVMSAHRMGVPHGRLIPENVMVTDTGAVKLIGFAVDSALHGGEPPPSSPLEEDPGGDVRNLAALLYACLVGRWPGRPGSVLPAAPTDHGAVLRARQVRAGVPKPLDTICDQVLNGTGPALPSAAALHRALGEFLGEDAPGADLGEQTAVLDVRINGRPSADDPEATQAAGFDAITTDARDTDPAGPPVRDTGAKPPARDTRVPGTGMGAGSVPDHWGPDQPDETGSGPAFPVRPEAAGTSWLKLGAFLAVVLLLALAVTIAVNLGRGPAEDGGNGAGSGKSGSSPGRPVTIAAVRDFDPEQDGGTPSENPQLVPLATDGDPKTAWRTLRYNDGPRLAPYKSGVGLLLDLGSEVEVSQVDLTLVGSPYDVQLLAAPLGSGAPTSTSGLATAAEASGVGGEVTLAPDEPVKARYLVVWLTALPPAGGGYQGQVAEIVVRG